MPTITTNDLKTGIMLVDLLLKQRAGDAAVRVLDTLLQSAPRSLRLRARKAEAQAQRGAHTDAIALWKGLRDDGVVTPEIDAAIDGFLMIFV